MSYVTLSRISKNKYIGKGILILKRGNQIYEGKTNTLYEVHNDDGTVNPYVLEMEATDRISNGDGAKVDIIEGKGHANNIVSTLLFKELEKAEVPTQYIGPGTTEESMLVRKAKMVPLEVICRNYTAGDFCRRYGCDEGKKLYPMLVELRYENDQLQNPLITFEAAVAMGIVDDYALCQILDYSEVVNEVATQFFEKLGLTLIDFKVEFGFDCQTGKLILADEFSQDTCRLHDANGNSVDKDLFRRGYSNSEVSKVYKKLAYMLEKAEKQ